MLDFQKCATNPRRLIAFAGAVEIGYVFLPDQPKSKKFEWMSKLPGDHPVYHREKSLEAAQEALQTRWAAFVAATGLSDNVFHVFDGETWLRTETFETALDLCRGAIAACRENGKDEGEWPSMVADIAIHYGSADAEEADRGALPCIMKSFAASVWEDAEPDPDAAEEVDYVMAYSAV